MQCLFLEVAHSQYGSIHACVTRLLCRHSCLCSFEGGPALVYGLYSCSNRWRSCWGSEGRTEASAASMCTPVTTTLAVPAVLSGEARASCTAASCPSARTALRSAPESTHKQAARQSAYAPPQEACRAAHLCSAQSVSPTQPSPRPQPAACDGRMPAGSPACKQGHPTRPWRTRTNSPAKLQPSQPRTCLPGLAGHTTPCGPGGRAEVARGRPCQAGRWQQARTRPAGPQPHPALSIAGSPHGLSRLQPGSHTSSEKCGRWRGHKATRLCCTPVESCPRGGAIASNSSKNSAQGAAAAARANRSRTAASDCPMYLFSSSGPLTLTNLKAAGTPAVAVCIARREQLVCHSPDVVLFAGRCHRRANKQRFATTRWAEHEQTCKACLRV